MKIALPTLNGVIDDHFGHCDHYTIYTVEGNTIVKEETMSSPQGCGCKSNIASEFAKAGVLTMLAGNMGQGALNVLNSNGIKVIRGCKGPIREVCEAYLRGELKDNAEVCDHQDCSHH